MQSFLKQWFDLFFWWLPRTDQRKEDAGATQTAEGSRQPEEAQPARAEEAPRESASARREAAPEAPTAEPSPRAEAPAQQPEPARPTPAAEAAAEAEAEADDLTVIKGIGPAIQQKLNNLGITTFADLARADPEGVAERLDMRMASPNRVREWVAAAKKKAG